MGLFNLFSKKKNDKENVEINGIMPEEEINEKNAESNDIMPEEEIKEEIKREATDEEKRMVAFIRAHECYKEIRSGKIIARWGNEIIINAEFVACAKELVKLLPGETIESGFLEEYKGKCLNHFKHAQYLCILLQHIGVLQLYYTVNDTPQIVGHSKLSCTVEEAMWRLDALLFYYSHTDIVAPIKGIGHLVSSYTDERKKRESESENSRRAAIAQLEIEEEKKKIKEKERKKALKELAKKQLEIETKIEASDLYGEILYRGKMYVLRSKEDVISFLNKYDSSF